MKPEKKNGHMQSRAAHRNEQSQRPGTKNRNNVVQLHTKFSATSDEGYYLAMFHRAILQQDQHARDEVQRHFHKLALGWMHSHPKSQEASFFRTDESYVMQAFERFWQTAATEHALELAALPIILRYLQGCLNSVIIETLRVHAQPANVPVRMSKHASQQEIPDYNVSESPWLWKRLQHMFPGAREQRLAYLLFHCGLKPAEILRTCAAEFSDLQEIYRMQRHILERFLTEKGAAGEN